MLKRLAWGSNIGARAARLVHRGHRYRLGLCGHKAAEIGLVCLGLMVQGNVAGLTAGHFLIAARTGLLAMSPALAVTFTRYVGLLTNRWISSGLLAVSGFLADALAHQSHYPGAFTEAGLTAVGGFALAVLVSYTPVGRRLDALAEHLVRSSPGSPVAPTVEAGDLAAPHRP